MNTRDPSDGTAYDGTPCISVYCTEPVLSANAGPMKPSDNWNTRAVSPVVSVILLVAIAVILSGTLAVIVLGFAETASDSGPTTALSTVSDENSDNITFVHRAGDNLDPEELEVVGAESWSSPEEEIRAGDAIEVEPAVAADNVAVTWNDEQTSTILASTSPSKIASTGFIDKPVFFNSGSHPDGQVGKPKYVEKRGQYAYVVFQENPGYVVTYDVADPTNPTIADTVNTAPNNQNMNGGYALSINGDTLYVSQNGGSFTAVDITDPTSMSIRSREFTGDQGFDIATNGDYVYIADTYGSLRVFDVTNPSNPSQVATRSVSAGGVAVNGNELYVTDYSSNDLVVYDISSPGAPTQIGTYSVSFSFPVPVDAHGNKVYVQEYQGTTIDVVDITDPSSPSLIENITAPEQIPNGGAVRVTGGNLFLTTGSTGNGQVTIYDTDDFSSPIEEYAVPGGPNIETGDIDGNYLYLPNYTDDGLTIVRVK